MKVCPNCQSQYPDDANFCPQEACATPQGPRRLEPIVGRAAARARYEMESQLGGARSGEVWRARDTQTGATVAYKLVAPASLPTPAALERAQRELKQLQRAQSPRVARVLDFGKDADGRLFVASELVDGQPLDQLVAAHRAAAARSRQEDRRADRRGAARRAEGRRRPPRPVAQERARSARTTR